MSKIAEKIAYWYRHNIWKLYMVKNACKSSIITPAEYKEITGEDYDG